MPATYDFTPEQLKKIVDKFQPQANGCWHHPSKPNIKGYGQTRIGWPVTKSMLMHHLSWFYYRGDIPEGMVLDHLCHDPAVCVGGNNCEHRRCVNPEHLQLVTPRENSQKTVRLLKFKIHCNNGHVLTETMTFTKNKAYCGQCNKEQKKISYLKYKNDPVRKKRKAELMRQYRAARKAGV